MFGCLLAQSITSVPPWKHETSFTIFRCSRKAVSQGLIAFIGLPSGKTIFNQIWDGLFFYNTTLSIRNIAQKVPLNSQPAFLLSHFKCKRSQRGVCPFPNTFIKKNYTLIIAIIGYTKQNLKTIGKHVKHSDFFRKNMYFGIRQSNICEIYFFSPTGENSVVKFCSLELWRKRHLIKKKTLFT